MTYTVKKNWHCRGILDHKQLKIKIGSVNWTYSNRTRPTQGERNWGRVYTPVWNVCMVTLWKYTWFWDHLGLLNHFTRRRSWEKLTFHVIFQPIRTHNERCCWHMVIYEMSASMKVIWYLCQNTYGLEIIWSFLPFHKPYFVQNYSFRIIFIAIRGQSNRCGWHMVIYQRSASMNVIWYSCVNIHGLEIIWTFIVFEKPSLMRKITFQVLFLVKKFLGKIFFQQNFFCSECFNWPKNHVFQISIFHQNLNT